MTALNLSQNCPPLPTSPPRDAARYVLELCARIAACTDVPGTTQRLFLSPATRLVHTLLADEMTVLGMQVWLDATGNLRGLYAGQQADAPVLLVGSHIDTVPNAGAFDGVLGVALGLALVRGLGGRRLKLAVEVIAFSEEEGVRFRLPFIGSRGLVGTLGDSDLDRVDGDGISVRKALDSFLRDAPGPAAFQLGPGLNPDRIPDRIPDPTRSEAAGSAHPQTIKTSFSDGLTPGTFAYLECHIEQGPMLESLGLPLAIVTAIVGQTRLELRFSGTANHAGTTPMKLRQDALAAAAAWIGCVERYALGVEGLVATVGSIVVSPSAVNVIAAQAVVSLDVRHSRDAVREEAATTLLDAAKAEALKRGVTLASRETSRQPAVAMDSRLCEHLSVASDAAGFAAHRMVSGAGHDAMILRAKIPSGMLFVRTPKGLSHHPDEAVAEEDVAAAYAVLSKSLERLEAWQ